MPLAPPRVANLDEETGQARRLVMGERRWSFKTSSVRAAALALATLPPPVLSLALAASSRPASLPATWLAQVPINSRPRRSLVLTCARSPYLETGVS